VVVQLYAFTSDVSGSAAIVGSVRWPPCARGRVGVGCGARARLSASGTAGACTRAGGAARRLHQVCMGTGLAFPLCPVASLHGDALRCMAMRCAERSCLQAQPARAASGCAKESKQGRAREKRKEGGGRGERGEASCVATNSSSWPSSLYSAHFSSRALLCISPQHVARHHASVRVSVCVHTKDMDMDTGASHHRARQASANDDVRRPS